MFGPGLLETTYQQYLAHERSLRKICIQLEYPLPVEYKGVHLDCGYRIDSLVEGQIVLALKSVETLQGIKSFVL